MNTTFRQFLEHNPEGDLLDWLIERLQHCMKSYEQGIHDSVISLEKAKREMLYFVNDLHDVLVEEKGHNEDCF